MEEAKSGDYMINIVASIEDSFDKAIRAAYPSLPDPPILVTPAKIHGDYQCNSAMAVAKVTPNAHTVYQHCACDSSYVFQLTDDTHYKVVRRL